MSKIHKVEIKLKAFLLYRVNILLDAPFIKFSEWILNIGHGVWNGGEFICDIRDEVLDPSKGVEREIHELFYD